MIVSGIFCFEWGVLTKYELKLQNFSKLFSLLTNTHFFNSFNRLFRFEKVYMRQSIKEWTK